LVATELVDELDELDVSDSLLEVSDSESELSESLGLELESEGESSSELSDVSVPSEELSELEYERRRFVRLLLAFFLPFAFLPLLGFPLLSLFIFEKAVLI
jgi:hypothetical protein